MLRMMVYAERTHGGWIVLRVIFEGASEETGAFVIMFTSLHRGSWLGGVWVKLLLADV